MSRIPLTNFIYKLKSHNIPCTMDGNAGAFADLADGVKLVYDSSSETITLEIDDNIYILNSIPTVLLVDQIFQLYQDKGTKEDYKKLIDKLMEK